MTISAGHDDLLAASPEAMRAALSGAPETAAALLRAGAEAALPEAQALYGQILLDGRGVGRDPATALRWFWRAATAGDLMAINMVGRCYELGWGIAVDRAAAAGWYKVAAERGLDWGMYNYGSALGLGAGIEQDEAAALGWFRKAAELGHAKSLNFVGVFLEQGRLVPRDMPRAAECYRVAAEGGDFRAQFNHARLLAAADRPDEASVWLERAAATATPEFRATMKTFFGTAPHAGLRALALSW